MLSCRDHRSSKAKHSYPSTFVNELAVLFKAGTQVATVISDTGLTSKQKQVYQKFMRKVDLDPKLERYIEDYAKRLLETSHLIGDSESLGWIKKVGFDQREAAVLASIFRSRRSIAEKDTITISKDDEGIHFGGSGTLSMLDSLVVYFNDSSASIKADKLVQNKSGSTKFNPGLLPEDEHLEKYYCFEVPAGIAGLLPIGDHHYYLTVGRLNKTNRTYIYLQLTLINRTDPPSNQFYSIIIE